ncbi:succinate dehydrogenase cytochrome b subunit [Halpernia sp.]|uniref:succinate dehydrogenase cytochrome b subunit n=1 Tax=Halpernia sp. TaxID=2782209 RepID=UPI003A922BB7
MAGLSTSSIGRKYAMAISALLLLSFLVVHVSLNMISIFSKDSFNEASQFMGYNPFIQYFFQPILMIGVVFHFVMGLILEIKNNNARPIKYGMNTRSKNSTWMSRNMLITGFVILAFLGLHFYDFWMHEMNYKYIEILPENPSRYWIELHEKFADVWRVIIYVVAFVLLGLHLSHGFQSSFQSIGARHPKYTPFIKGFGTWFSILVPLAFIVIAIFHFVNQ